jgi:hypothetical protein
LTCTDFRSSRSMPMLADADPPVRGIHQYSALVSKFHQLEHPGAVISFSHNLKPSSPESAIAWIIIEEYTVLLEN